MRFLKISYSESVYCITTQSGIFVVRLFITNWLLSIIRNRMQHTQTRYGISLNYYYLLLLLIELVSLEFV